MIYVIKKQISRVFYLFFKFIFRPSRKKSSKMKSAVLYFIARSLEVTFFLLNYKTADKSHSLGNFLILY